MAGGSRRQVSTDTSARRSLWTLTSAFEVDEFAVTTDFHAQTTLQGPLTMQEPDAMTLPAHAHLKVLLHPSTASVAPRAPSARIKF